MKIFLSYGYWPFTTGVYFEKALIDAGHDIFYVGPSSGGRCGFSCNEDVEKVIENFGKADLFLFIEPPGDFFPRGLEKLECPTACYLIDVHSDIAVREKYALFFDYIFVAQKDYVNHFKELGHKNVYWLSLACDAEIHAEQNSSKIYDVGFVGNYTCSDRRVGLLKELSQRYTMNDYTRRYAKEDIATIYSQSKIVVNIPVKGDLNMRVFEAMASGSLLITEKINNGQKDFFKDRENIVEYETKQDLFEKIDFYLQHNDQREAIGKSGQSLVLSDHTYQKRISFVLDVIFGKQQLRQEAMIRSMSTKNIRLAYARVYTMLRLVAPVWDEIKLSIVEGSLSLALCFELVKVFLRKLNVIMPVTPGARRNRRKSKSC